MKKLKPGAFIICVLCLGLLFLSACAADTGPEYEEGKLNIICTVFPAYDFAREIGGERVNAVLLVPPGSESHSYEPTPRDIAALSECELIFANGGVGEAWLETVLSSGGMAEPLYMTAQVSLVEEEHSEGMQQAAHAHGHVHSETCEHGHEHGHDHSEYDEHVWTSPVNAVEICRALTERLSALDPEGEDYYRARFESYSEKLTALDRAFRETVESAPHRTMIFADRFPVRYFVEEYGLEYYAAFPGCAEETEPSAKTVAFLIDKVREQGISAVYYIEFSNEKMADVIVEDTGCKKLLFHSCHTVGKDELAAGVSYLELMEKNLLSLKEGLS